MESSHTSDGANREPDEAHEQETCFEVDELSEGLAIPVYQDAHNEEQSRNRNS